jgi:hypothetical protein
MVTLRLTDLQEKEEVKALLSLEEHMHELRDKARELNQMAAACGASCGASTSSRSRAVPTVSSRTGRTKNFGRSSTVRCHCTRKSKALMLPVPARLPLYHERGCDWGWLWRGDGEGHAGADDL